MEVMIQFTTQLLGVIADFLMSEPIFYLFSIICFIGIVKVFRVLAP